MAAVINRAKREIDFTRKCVPEGIGPGSYDSSNNPRFEVKHSQAPFSSTTDRAGLPENPGTIKTPGPGAYKIETSGIFSPMHRNLRPSSNFASSSARMGGEMELLKQAFMPGPGSYSGPAVRPKDWLKSSANKPSSAASGGGGGGPKPTTPLTKSINWVKVSTAPSIPAPSQSFGYEEGPKGELIQQKPPTAASGPANTGPGCYNPNHSLLTRNVPAIKFGISKSSRLAELNKEAKLVPGPGSYDLVGPILPIEDEMRPSHVFLSSSGRSKISSEKADLPGPGAYNAPSMFKPPPDLAAMFGVPAHLQCFGSTSRKLHEMGSEQHPIPMLANKDIPGPGAYTVSLTAFEKMGKSRTKRAMKGKDGEVSSFGIGARFSNSAETNKLTPGPGYYTSEADSLSRKVQGKLSGRYGVFGTTSQRFTTVTNTDPKLGPGAYPVSPSATVTAPSAQQVRRKDPRQAIFASRTERKAGAALNGGKSDDVPAVGAYETPAPQWIKRQSTQLADFMPHAPRFAEQKMSNTPGPGHYVCSRDTIESTVLGNDLAVYKGEVRKTGLRGLNRRGVPKQVGPLTARFKEETKADFTPGPGAYESDNSGLLKRTFNITIGDTWS